jgi:hypothetical protein
LTDLDKKYIEMLKQIDQTTDNVASMPERLQVTFQNPEPNYYDGKFATQFENCIKDKFEGLDTINEVPSDYVL